jgi:spore coat polysaccharide biosynthesis protein SpsF (cytidylyltransferase family)
LKTAFIVCSRADSTRLPGKPFRKIAGKPVLTHLCQRLAQTNIPVILAIPPKEVDAYAKIATKDDGIACLYLGDEHDPLARMYAAAKDQDIDHVIRVTHDKIFVDPDLVLKALDQYLQNNLDYLYSSHFTEGSGFEIISYEALEKAAQKYKNVEFISYAIRSVTTNSMEFDVPAEYRSDARLLIDYPDDMQLMQTIFSVKDDTCTLKDVIQLCDENKWIKDINKLPELTLYTCVYNGEKYIERAMGSISRQKHFKDFEYVIVDDASTDKTYYLASKFTSLYPNVRLIRNETNLGLASSSNVALKNARGKYIMRLDADDYFVHDTSAKDMVNTIKRRQLEAVYPNNYFGTLGITQNGKDSHHVGGAIFSTRAINHIKFMDGLRGYEGLDFFQRAKDVLKIGYLAKATFFYSQRPDSMSKTDLDARAKIKELILSGEL